MADQEQDQDRSAEIVHPQELERPEDKKVRLRSIRIGQLSMFIFATGFSIILTGVYPYMKEVCDVYFLQPILCETFFENREHDLGWVDHFHKNHDVTSMIFFY